MAVLGLSKCWRVSSQGVWADETWGAITETEMVWGTVLVFLSWCQHESRSIRALSRTALSSSRPLVQGRRRGNVLQPGSVILLILSLLAFGLGCNPACEGTKAPRYSWLLVEQRKRKAPAPVQAPCPFPTQPSYQAAERSMCFLTFRLQMAPEMFSTFTSVCAEPRSLFWFVGLWRGMPVGDDCGSFMQGASGPKFQRNSGDTEWLLLLAECSL